MKIEYMVNLKGYSDLCNFCNSLNKEITEDVDAICKHKTIDAKSLLGMAAISHEPIMITLNSSNKNTIEKFTEICKRYEI